MRCERALAPMAVPSRQPREALCALFYTVALCLMCVCVLRRLARGGNPVRSPRAKDGPAPPEHQPCNGRPQGQPAQVRKHDVRKAGRQSPPVPHGQRAIPKVASLGATAGAKDGDAYPKQQPRHARPTATSRGNWQGSGPLPMKSTRPCQERNVAPQKTQATPSTATNKPGTEQRQQSSKANVPNVCVCVRVCPCV